MKYLPSIILFIGYLTFGIFGNDPFLGLMCGIFGIWSLAMAKFIIK